MTTTTARVEVLTAEVRTLQVGARQVTLSVYNQLDRVALHTMTPFGRVSVKRRSDPWDDGGWEQVDLVGADRDGVLVASWFSHRRYPDEYADPAGKWRNRELAEQTWDEVRELPLIVLAGLR